MSLINVIQKSFFFNLKPLVLIPGIRDFTRHSFNPERKFSKQERNILLVFILEKFMRKTFKNSQLLDNI